MAEVIDLTLDDSSDEEGVPTFYVEDVSRTQLHDAIDNVSESRLRQVMKNLVDEDPAIGAAVLDELMTVRKRTREVVSRWETCANCEEEFDVSTAREDEECTYHTGICFFAFLCYLHGVH
jgi:hypothetical protein